VGELVLLPPLIVMERLSARGALTRSGELVHGSWFRVAVVDVLAITVTWIVALAPFLTVVVLGQMTGLTVCETFAKAPTCSPGSRQRKS
jgi:hypothetical protein